MTSSRLTDVISRSYSREAILCVFCASGADRGSLVACGRPVRSRSRRLFDGGPPEFEGPPVRVVCTTTIVADVVQRVGGDRVTVETLMGPGVDPHRYLPTAGDRKKLEAAHLVFFNGLHLEGKMADMFEKSRGRDPRGTPSPTTSTTAQLRHADVDGGEHDPHVWFDVKLWTKCVGVGARRARRPSTRPGRTSTSANAAAYLKELEALDAEVRDEARTRCRRSGGCWSRRTTPSGTSAGRTGSRSAGCRASAPRARPARRSVTGAGRRSSATNRSRRCSPKRRCRPTGSRRCSTTCGKDYKHEVKLVGGDDALYSDALGEPGSPGGTYPGMVRHNVDGDRGGADEVSHGCHDEGEAVRTSGRASTRAAGPLRGSRRDPSSPTARPPSRSTT